MGSGGQGVVSVKGCEFLTDRYYDIDHHVCYLPMSEGRSRIGLAQVGIDHKHPEEAVHTQLAVHGLWQADLHLRQKV